MPGIASKPAASEGVSPGEAARFAGDLERLWPEGGPLGLAVSGGPDSLALLLLASAAKPNGLAVATVNHGLRREARDECAMVERLCRERGIACTVLTVATSPGNMQASAREARYRALAEWAAREGIGAVLTAHHADDQAETLVMRLNRASGLAGLAGVRARGTVPGTRLPLLRPLLGWRRAELADIVERAGLAPVQDPTNDDDAYDRVRIRKALVAANWLEVESLAASAAHLADADEAIEWMVEREWAANVSIFEGGLRYEPEAPRVVALRVVTRIVRGFGGSPRGGAVARLIGGLANGESSNLGGVAASADGKAWVFQPESPRRG